MGWLLASLPTVSTLSQQYKNTRGQKRNPSDQLIISDPSVWDAYVHHVAPFISGRLSVSI